jgi:hypothetical protein
MLMADGHEPSTILHTMHPQQSIQALKVYRKPSDDSHLIIENFTDQGIIFYRNFKDPCEVSGRLYRISA